MELPNSVQEIADVIGRDKALYLIGQLPTCGSRSWRVVLYIPKRLPTDHHLVRLLGWRDAHALSRVFGGEILQPSNCRFIAREHRKRTAQDMQYAGCKVAEVAEVLGVSERHARRLIADAAPEDKAPANDNTPNHQRGAVCAGGETA